MKIGPDYSSWINPDYSLEMLGVSEKAGFDSVWFGDHFLLEVLAGKRDCCSFLSSFSMLLSECECFVYGAQPEIELLFGDH
jgi:alkanesulfonate monooxygenase SsuD/methylene tetrahydromethanopterin reductase-like flavin-dependent oxidoreductase (luciferase family)